MQDRFEFAGGNVPLQVASMVSAPGERRAIVPLVDTPVSELQSIFAGMRDAYLREPMPPYEVRVRRLRALRDLVEAHEDELASAISADFGNRSRFETAMAGVLTSLAEINHTLRNLRRWMRPRRVATPIYLFPARARIERQPVGVVGIISPWNYPLFLSIPPAVGALAAGNRVILKPSELTPNFAELLRKLVASRFATDEFCVVIGGREVGEALTRLPLNHLFFTGSSAVGRKVAAAAAENLTPITLELGGKSPAIVGEGSDLDEAGRRIAYGKLINAGQTCIAPDYAFVPRAQLREFAGKLRASAEKLYPDAANNPQYTSLIHDHGFKRMYALIEEAQRAGAEVITVGELDPTRRRMSLHIVLNPPRHCTLLREEIFGPVLPVLPYDSLDEVIAYINAGPRPLALYYFGYDGRQQRRVLDETVSGGVTLNDTLWHIGHPNLPLGGAGESGTGAYHGEYSFRRFSHEKAVLSQGRWTASPLLHPPYGKAAQWTLKLLRKLV